MPVGALEKERTCLKPESRTLEVLANHSKQSDGLETNKWRDSAMNHTALVQILPLPWISKVTLASHSLAVSASHLQDGDNNTDLPYRFVVKMWTKLSEVLTSSPSWVAHNYREGDLRNTHVKHCPEPCFLVEAFSMIFPFVPFLRTCVLVSTFLVSSLFFIFQGSKCVVGNNAPAPLFPPQLGTKPTKHF